MKIYTQRIDKLNQLLSKNGCDGLIVEDAINLYYLTGLEMSSGRLIVHPKGACLFVDSRYYEICKKMSPVPVILSDNGLPLADLFNGPELNSLKCMGFSSDTTTYERFLQLQTTLQSKNMQLKALNNPVFALRAVKDAGEIVKLKKAAALGSEGFDYICSLLKENITEKEVALELEIFWKRKGAQGLAFNPIIAFGANSSMPHYRGGDKKLQRGEGILIDIGVLDDHYHSDMTRVVYFGKPQDEILKIHEIVLNAQERALALCKPGTVIGDLDFSARGYIADQGYGAYFMHGLGHGVGLEIHEAPSIRNKEPMNQVVLEEGMVITIEPGIYLPDIGGVRIEDTVLITAQGYENLTNRVKRPVIIE